MSCLNLSLFLILLESGQVPDSDFACEFACRGPLVLDLYRALCSDSRSKQNLINMLCCFQLGNCLTRLSYRVKFFKLKLFKPK